VAFQLPPKPVNSFNTSFSALTPSQGKAALATRLSPVADRIRNNIATRMGVNPYRVFLVHTAWAVNGERGEGTERELSRVELLPVPNVTSLDSIALSPGGAGLIQMGSLRISLISSTRYTHDQLIGKLLAAGSTSIAPGEQLPQNVNFFWEVTEDGRGDLDPVRRRFRVSSTPVLKTDSAQWQVMLEKQDGDRPRESY